MEDRERRFPVLQARGSEFAAVGGGPCGATGAGQRHLHARQAQAPYACMESLLDALSRVRRAMIVRRSAVRTGKRAERITYQLEEIDPDVAPLLPILGVPG